MVQRLGMTTCLRTRDSPLTAITPSETQQMKAALIDPGLSTPSAAPPAHEETERWPWDSLSRSTVVLLGTLCALTFLILPAAVSLQQRQWARCSTQRPAAARLDKAVRWEPQEALDNATFAICVIMNVPADDPQWVDGRAEDVHEVRGCWPWDQKPRPYRGPVIELFWTCSTACGHC